MPKVVIIEASGASRELNARVGQTLMEVARDNDVQGIVAECGGACACATCHIHVVEPWMGVTGLPSEIESSMLELTESPSPMSRLACQITVTAEMDGLVVRVPKV